jgi:hypothetical protein
MPTPIDELSQRADNAASAYAAEVKRFLRPDGSRQFSDQVHNQMETAARSKMVDTFAALMAEADQRLAAAEVTAGSIQDDPTAHMSAQELSTASARFPLVREEANELPLGDVYQRLQQAANAKDRVSMYLWSRVAKQRLAGYDEAARRASAVNMSDQPVGGRVAPVPALDAVAVNQLRGLLPNVEAALVPDSVRAKVAQARATVEAAQSFKFKMRQRLEELNGELPKFRATLERDFRQGF